MRQSKRDASPFNTTVDDGVRLVAAADRLAGGTAASSLTGGGVLAFYLLVVVGIGRAVRSSCGGTRYRLAVDEMPDTRDVIDLCEGVYIARREGQLLRETELQEVDRHHCWVPLFPYLSPIYLSLYLYLSLEIDLYLSRDDISIQSAGDGRAALPQCGEPHSPHGLPARPQRGRVIRDAARAVFAYTLEVPHVISRAEDH